jgi:hypothetical protein
MALSSATVWEVRPAGSGASDSNGGGFVAGASGTDFSQQDSAAYSGTNLAIDATTNTKVTSATHNFVAADVGNLIQITAGSGFTTGFYQIVSVASNAATLDRSAGTLGSTGGTWALGGALASPSKALANMVTANQVWVRQGTYTVSTTPTLAAGGAAPGSTQTPNRLTGYASTRGDTPTGSTRPTLRATGTTTTLLPLTQTGWWLENLILDCNSVASSGVTSGQTWNTIRNCKVLGFLQYGISLTADYQAIWACEITGGTAAASAAANITFDKITLAGCAIHDNACPGVLGGGGRFLHNLITNNTGASSDGIRLSNYNFTLVGNTLAGNGRDGIRVAEACNIALYCVNNLCASNGGYGLNFANGLVPAAPEYDTNAYYNNTSGARNNCGSGAHDVLLTADPFTNSAGGNFALNNTAGGGAAAKAAGIPGAFPGGTTTGYPDLGAVQSQGGGGGTKRRVWGN